jgi:hypothetical protein
MDNMLDEVFELGDYAPRQRRRMNMENVIAAFGTPPPRRRDPRNVWDAPRAAGGGSELMSQRGGTLPGHANLNILPVQNEGVTSAQPSNAALVIANNHQIGQARQERDQYDLRHFFGRDYTQGEL